MPGSVGAGRRISQADAQQVEARVHQLTGIILRQAGAVGVHHQLQTAPVRAAHQIEEGWVKHGLARPHEMDFPCPQRRQIFTQSIEDRRIDVFAGVPVEQRLCQQRRVPAAVVAAQVATMGGIDDDIKRAATGDFSV